MFNIIELEEAITQQLISLYKVPWEEDRKEHKSGYVEGLNYVRRLIREKIEIDEKREKEKSEERKKRNEKIWMKVFITANTLLIILALLKTRG